MTRRRARDIARDPRARARRRGPSHDVPSRSPSRARDRGDVDVERDSVTRDAAGCPHCLGRDDGFETIGRDRHTVTARWRRMDDVDDGSDASALATLLKTVDAMRTRVEAEMMGAAEGVSDARARAKTLEETLREREARSVEEIACIAENCDAVAKKAKELFSS